MERVDRRAIEAPLATSAVLVLVVTGLSRGPWLANLHNGLLALVFAGVGSHLVYQLPRNREGRLFLATGLVEGVLFCGRQIAHAEPSASGDRWWAWLGVWPIALGLGLTTMSVICFPDGRLPDRGWRWPARVLAAVVVVCAALSALWPVEYAAAGVSTPFPFHLGGFAVASSVWDAVAHPLYAVLQLSWLVAVLLRWRTSSGRTRAQLFWVVVAAAASGLTLAGGLLVLHSPVAGLLAASVVPLAAGWSIVHGQRVATYAVLGWLSRTGPGASDLPTEAARAAAEALGAGSATLWMGPADDLHAVGVWPGAAGAAEVTSLGALAEAPGAQVRPVLRGGVVVGAVSVNRAQAELAGRADERLLEHVASQAAFVLDHLGLSRLVADRQRSDWLPGLTPRESDVLELMARGLSNQAICSELHLSIKSVEPVVSSIFAKLGLHPAADSNRRVLAVVHYLQRGRASLRSGAGDPGAAI